MAISAYYARISDSSQANRIKKTFQFLSYVSLIGDVVNRIIPIDQSSD